MRASRGACMCANIHLVTTYGDVLATLQQKTTGVPEKIRHREDRLVGSRSVLDEI